MKKRSIRVNEGGEKERERDIQFFFQDRQMDLSGTRWIKSKFTVYAERGYPRDFPNFSAWFGWRAMQRTWINDDINNEKAIFLPSEDEG